MFNMTDEQKLAALTLDRPIVVTAAAGSGKTTVLVARYIELLKRGLNPHEILTVTFTNDAAQQLKTRIQKTLGTIESLSPLVSEVERTRFIGTIHSFCYFLISEYGTLLGYPPIESILSDYQFQVALENSYRKWLYSLSRQSLAHLLSFVSRNQLKEVYTTLYNSRHTLSSFSKEISQEFPLQIFYESALPSIIQLEQSFLSEGFYRFDDLEFLSAQLLKQQSPLRSRLQTQFKAVLIDEFQDTSQSQWDIFQLLLGSDYNKLFVVGDPKQSIYSFRHADVSLFFKVSQLVEQWDGLVAELNTNFRTQSTLIGDINRYSQTFFEKSPISFSAMKSGIERAGEAITVNVYNCAAEAEKKVDKKELELQAVLQAVDNYLGQGNRPEDLALLFRMGDRIDVYTEALKAKGLQVECTQTLSLFAHYDVLNLNHYLKALSRPRDSFSLGAFLVSPWVGVTLSQLADITDDSSVFPFEEKVKNFLSPKLHWFFNLADKPRIYLREALFELFSNSTYFPEHSEAFYEWLKPLTEKNYTLHEALADLDLWKKEGILFKSKTGSASSGAIKLMTVHASKGLEFEHVFLVDSLRRSPTQLPTILTSPNEPPSMKYMEHGETIIPSQYIRLKELKEKMDGEESRRILYVALTRARETLSLFLPSEMKGVPKDSWASLLVQPKTADQD